jgi:hypothetical protein
MPEVVAVLFGTFLLLPGPNCAGSTQLFVLAGLDPELRYLGARGVACVDVVTFPENGPS